MQIDYLANHPEFIPTVARWHHKEWAYLRPGESLTARVRRLRDACGDKAIPTVVIAFTDSTLLGSAMLVAHDMDTRMDLSPWLAGVFVSPARRRRGIGVALVQRIIDDARTLGVQRLYLYTPSAEQFYSRLGWAVVERASYRGAEVVVMSCEVRPNTVLAGRQRQTRREGQPGTGTSAHANQRRPKLSVMPLPRRRVKRGR